MMDIYNASAPAGQQITYQMSAHTFSDHATKLLPLNPVSDGNVAAMKSAISAIAPPLMADNSYLPVGGSYNVAYPVDSGCAFPPASAFHAV
jgi:DNA-directed RNA polymerase beta subunit